MEIKIILIYLLVLISVSNSKAQESVSLVALDYKITLDFFLSEEVANMDQSVSYGIPGVLTITAEALITSNQFKLVRNNFRTSDCWRRTEVNVTNLSGNKTIRVSSVTACEHDAMLVCVLLEDSFRADDHLEIIMTGEFPDMRVREYDDYDISTNRREKKFNGIFKPYQSIPILSYGDETQGSSYPLLPMHFNIGLGGRWKNSNKIITSLNYVGKIKDRWIYFEKLPIRKLQYVAFFISEIVNYTVFTERNTKVSVWGRPSIIFENGIRERGTTEYANYTVTLARSLLNNYEKLLDMKYPLDGLQIIYEENDDDLPEERKYAVLRSAYYRILGQIHLGQRGMHHIRLDLSDLVYEQFFDIVMAGPILLCDYVQAICLEEEFYNPNAISMLEGFLTREVILNGIRIHFKSHIWKGSPNVSFFDALEESISRENGSHLFLPTGVKVKDAVENYGWFKSFHRQFNVSLVNRETSQIQLTFDSKHGTNFTHSFDSWFPVQVKLAVSSGISTKILEETFWIPPNTSVHTITRIDGHTLTNSSKIRWLLVNINLDGYNTNYDAKILSLLASQLNKNYSVFSAIERYNILLKSSLSNLENWFIFTRYFGQETDRHLWFIAMSILYKYRFLYMGNHEAYQEVRKHFVPKMESYMESRGGFENMLQLEGGFPFRCSIFNVGWRQDKYKNELNSCFRDACLLLRAPSCLRFASEHLKQYGFTKDWRKMIWFDAAGADPENFEYLKQQFLNLSDKPDFRKKYFEALEWTGNDTLYESFLNSVLGRNSEALLFQRTLDYPTIATSESRLALLVNFSKTNFQNGRISSHVFENIVKYVLKHYFNSGFVKYKTQYEDLKLFIGLNQGKLDASHYSSLQNYITCGDGKVFSPESYWNKNGKEFLLWLKSFNNEGYTIPIGNGLRLRR